MKTRAGHGVVTALLAAFALALGWSPAARAQFDQGHAAWSALLKKHVVVLGGGKASQVRYAGMATDREALRSYLSALAKPTAAEFASWPKQDRLAFLINAYNAGMIELILTRYPDIQSVWDFGKVFNNPFKQRFIRLFGRDMSLDNIEHDTIRAEGAYDDPRIHMAVNCASIGCPMLREEAFTGDKLDRQLDEQVVRFLSDRTRNRYNPETRTLEVSKIFDWYGGDFRKGHRGIATLEAFLGRHAQLLADRPEDQKPVAEGRMPIRFLEYDWGLNRAK